MAASGTNQLPTTIFWLLKKSHKKASLFSKSDKNIAEFVWRKNKENKQTNKQKLRRLVPYPNGTRRKEQQDYVEEIERR